MSREIKFRYRLQHLTKNGYEEWFEIYTIKDLEMAVSINYATAKIISRDQYTGLFDKNGKEIYEGDIVQCHTTGKYKWPHMGKVEYLNSFYAINCGKGLDDSDEFSPLSHNENFEVLGNIYENAELLNKEEKRIK